MVHARGHDGSDTASREDLVAEGVPGDRLRQADPAGGVERVRIFVAAIYVHRSHVVPPRGRCAYPDVVAVEGDRVAEAIAGDAAERREARPLEPCSRTRVTAVEEGGSVALSASRRADDRGVALYGDGDAEVRALLDP